MRAGLGHFAHLRSSCCNPASRHGKFLKRGEVTMADVLGYEATGQPEDEFGVIDLTTGVFTPLSNTGLTLAGLGSYGGVIYAGAYHGNTLYSINTSTGALTAIGTGNVSYGDFGSTTSGLYAFGLNGDLYSINPTNGAATDIG